MPRANVALPHGFTGTREGRLAGTRIAPGQVPLPCREPHYYPTKGFHFGNRLILKHPKAMLRAWRSAGDWLCKADPWTDPSGFAFMAEFWRALNEHIEPRGEMAIRQSCNHI